MNLFRGPDCCPDCGVVPGSLHIDGCYVERCPVCGLQAFSCGHDATERRMRWTGEPPGWAQCREFGWYAVLRADVGWTPCAADALGATPDLNRLYSECRWNVDAQRWERPPLIVGRETK
jgi:hypothetical protein